MPSSRAVRLRLRATAAFAFLAFLCGLAAALPRPALAAFPDHALRLVVPFSPGGGTSAHLAGELFKALAKVDLNHTSTAARGRP
ncbi:hypothetical protein [Cupriavidus malaysiensis]|uniref:Tripartite tricarboxylate transporter substrate binding protein n=1 Tax=Cupriavidus malaysiensis TaxID=367825 RepID=A0ABM6FAH3_9BURK|nr:hypothetical protein BKK80_22665 [Cupriavidus malaysiensis]